MPKSNYVTIKSNDETKVHLPHTDGNYATLCGLDGDDSSPKVDQMQIETKSNAKVNCWHCIRIWLLCRDFSTYDFDTETFKEIKARFAK